MARVLFIGCGSPWRGGAGYLVRQNLFLSALAQVAELHLAMFDSPAQEAPAFAAGFTSLTMPTRPPMSRVKLLAEDLISPDPRMIRGYDLTQPRKQVQALNPLGFDAVFAYRIDFAYFAGVLDHPRLILDIDDPEHVRGLRRLRAAGVPADRRTLRDLTKLRDFERRSVAQAKLAFVCQDNDRDGWNTLPEVVPNCVHVPMDPLRRVGKPIVLFVGNCSGGEASPNVDALRFFLADVWPRILQEIPAAEFHIVGGGTETIAESFAQVPGVRWRGFVDDLAETYVQSAVSVAPIRFGTGTRVKILEAFAHSCPVVSTLAGAEGIEVVPGKNIELAEGAADFAARTIGLLRDAGLAERIGQAGYALVLLRYDLATQQHNLAARLGDFLRARAAG
jgi:polysaccharide biosynthesis protein PslH